MKTSDLTGAALEWAVAIAHGWTDIKITGYDCPDGLLPAGQGHRYRTGVRIG